MKVNLIFFAANPFIDAYIHSDFLGKLIFLSLIALSVVCWIILCYKWWFTRQVRKFSLQFKKHFEEQKANPLGLEAIASDKQPNPFLDLYLVLKKHTIDILNKNKRFGAVADEGASYLSSTDLDVVESHLFTTVAYQVKRLEKNLFMLSTIVSLAPFLGLLGTVWGILTTFSELQGQTGGTQQMILGGLSLALATTVLGLIDAIPALIGYNYLKNAVRDFTTDMECFATEILTSVERQYRKVDIQ
jgi:biopolymer transport protein TolQ